MAKPASTMKAPVKKKATKKEPNADSNPAFKWQMGGLIAGIIVALISTTEPGQQVCESRRERGGEARRLLSCALLCCLGSFASSGMHTL